MAWGSKGADLLVLMNSDHFRLLLWIFVCAVRIE